LEIYDTISIYKQDEKGRIEQGIIKGIIKGRIEERIKIAKNLLDVLDVEIISKKTGLSIEEIKKLKNK
jgi:predicted transposase/invertase (TIGR01784 family)